MPRKADIMLASDHAETQQGGVLDGIEQYELPRSAVVRIAKTALPPSTKLQKDSVLALIKGSTVFINYIAAAAQEVATASGRKTISSADVLQALEAAEFGDMLPKLTSELEMYRSHLKKNPPKPNAPKPASSTGANSKARVPQPKSGFAVATKGQASSGGGETRTEAESGASPKGDEEAAFSETDIPDEDGDQDGNQDELGLDEDEDAGGEDEDEEENDVGNIGNNEEMQVDDEDAGDASQSPR